MKKYIAYYRVSTQKQSLGLEVQRTSVINYLASTNGKLISEFSERESGKNDNRIELFKAIDECKRTNSILIIAKLDRLSRNVAFVFTLKESNIEFVACDLPTFNTLTLAVFCGLAQQERELISQRTKLALSELKNRGVKLGRPNACFSDEDRKKAALANSIIADNNENNKRAKLMVEALLKVTSNKTIIANKLNESGFKTARGKEFTSIQVIRLIRRYNLA